MHSSIKLIAVSTFICIMAGCKTQGEIQGDSLSTPGATPSPQPAVYGVNLEEHGQGDAFLPKPLPNRYYGQLVFRPSITKSIVQGTDAKGLLDHLKDLFRQEVTEFGISSVPTIDGVRLPQVVLFSYQYDSNANTWTSDLREEYVSPLVLLSGSTPLEYEFSFVAAKQGQSKIAKAVSNVVNTMGAISPGSWSVSQLSKPVIDQVTSSADSIISNMLTKTVNANVHNQFQPAFNGRRSKSYKMIGKGNETLAVVEVSVRLVNQLDGTIQENLTSDFQQSIPTVDPVVDARSTLKIDGKPGSQSIGQYLRSDDNGLITNLRNSENNSEEFRDQCRRIINRISDTARYSIIDVMRIMQRVLKETRFEASVELYDSNCLTNDELDLLMKMGIPLVRPTLEADFDEDVFNMFGNYSRDPINFADKRVVLEEEFADTVSLTLDEQSKSLVPVYRNSAIQDRVPISLSKEVWLNYVAQFEVAKFCCYRRPIIGEDYQRNGAIIFLRTRNSATVYQMELYWQTSPLINNIYVEVAKDEKLSKSDRSRIYTPYDANDNFKNPLDSTTVGMN